MPYERKPEEEYESGPKQEKRIEPEECRKTWKPTYVRVAMQCSTNGPNR